jgi:hypothetical protein
LEKLYYTIIGGDKMKDWVNDFLRQTRRESAIKGFLKVRPKVICATTLTMSIQTGEGLYCEPRDANGPYTKVEVGYPSRKPPRSWAKYLDGDNFRNDWQGVYAYIPVELVNK